MTQETHPPKMQDPIITPRLTLVRLEDTSEGSQHLLWFHELWTDKELTAWSLRGPTHSMQESREWMIKREQEFGDIHYAVFEPTSTSNGTPENPGLLVGSISLRLQASGPDLPPPPRPSPSSNSAAAAAAAAAAEEEEEEEEEEEATNKPINLRVIGYALRETVWGKGYATEVGKALISAYTDFIKAEKDKGEEVFYMEGVADKDNPASQRVLEKIGFRRVGWKDEEEKVFLAGKWRDPGYWVYGLWL